MGTSRRQTLGAGLAAIAACTALPILGRNRRGRKIALALDVSRSVTKPRFELQRDGHIEALLHEHTLEAIERHEEPIAFMAFYWAIQQIEIVPWTIVRTRADVRSFCAAFAACPRPAEALVGARTHIGQAIDFSRTQFLSGPFQAAHNILDICGDGGESDNPSRTPEDARDAAVAADIVINGMPIIAKTSPPQPKEGLDVYYKERVIGGDGSFIVAAHGFDDVRRMMPKKLIREIG
jgi:hypothetical protein